ncbi:hypothetical protein HanRHA438_Chr00c16g0850371 [Helianthus annuus]|nr:hypothetical protein HanHA89_Chr08g0297991 [Helianthus annuus]KAJ0897929.1 hypothetical protein HanRHA438_Chr08g0351141 [Helianthus annuus]KAJ0901676.1 hypothetical protein HanPSC8_Chr08g0328111 [Helianthus annuus]KAJ0954460.1 hypothetical protein HanRHA438_Chr00c16g0850371 [Helianthus annuus]
MSAVCKKNRVCFFFQKQLQPHNTHKRSLSLSALLSLQTLSLYNHHHHRTTSATTTAPPPPSHHRLSLSLYGLSLSHITHSLSTTTTTTAPPPPPPPHHLCHHTSLSQVLTSHHLQGNGLTSLAPSYPFLFFLFFITY